MTQKRGWIWLFSGALLALIAGLLTFRTINEATTNATLSKLEEMPTLQVLVAGQDIGARQLIDESMIKTQKIPATLVPEGYIKEAVDVVGKISQMPLVAGEILLSSRLLSPTDPTSPVLYKMKSNEVLLAVPATAILGQTGMLAVGDRIDLAYTVAIDFDSAVADAERQDAEPVTTFLSLQNLEIKGLLRRQPSTEETTSLLRPDALLLAVSPQDALVIKHLVDTGAPMDFLLRAPGNEALSPVLPVDAQYLIDRFQLPAAPTNLASDREAIPPAADGSVNLTASNILSNTINDAGAETESGQ